MPNVDPVAPEQGAEAVVARLGGALFGALFVGPIQVSCNDWMSVWEVSSDLKEVARGAFFRDANAWGDEPNKMCARLGDDVVAYLALRSKPRRGALIVPVAEGASLVFSGVPSDDSRWSRLSTVVEGLRVQDIRSSSEDGVRCSILRDAGRMARRLSDAEAVRTVDPDTGLMNKAAFLGVLEQAIARNRRDKKPFTVALLDVEYAPDAVLNDESIMRGDVLRDVARALENTVRREDYVARIGPWRFACLFLGGDGQESPAALDRIRRNLRRMGITGQRGVRMSAGATTCHQGASSPIEVLNNAEIMLALEKGRRGSA